MYTGVLFITFLALTSGHPLEANPFADNEVSPAPKLSPRTDISLETVNDLEKREEFPYTCPPQYKLCEAFCAGPGGNTLFWTCVVPSTGTRTLPKTKDCGDLVCVPRFLGEPNNVPAPGCGAKAACVSIARLVHILAKSGATTCQGLNAAVNGRTVQVISRIWDAALFRKGVRSPKAPDQIILSDGPNIEFQKVGPADEQGGIFVSRPFKYIGGVKECVRLASYQADVDVYSALIVR